jgi:hypothetical protein
MTFLVAQMQGELSAKSRLRKGRQANELRVIAADGPSRAVDVLPEQQVAYAMLEHWHKGRCAICGQIPARGGLARDHDHAGGLIRGLLCFACNTAESRPHCWLFRNFLRCLALLPEP